MSYLKSKSLKQFEESSLVLLNRFRKCEQSVQDYSLKVLVFQGSILLTCSSLENYLKSLIDEWIYKLKQNGALMSSIPEVTRKVLYVRSQGQIFRSFAFDGDEQKASSKIDFEDFAFALSNSDKVLPAYMLGKHIYVNKKYPSVENIKKMFSTLGLPNVFSHMQMVYRKDYKLNLESFLSVRESLAHEFPPDVTYADAKRQVINASVVARKLDIIAYNHIASVSGYAYWPS